MCWNGYGGGDTEAEREGAAPWESDGDLPWAPNPVEKPQPWEEWPESLAGPEYWLWKQQQRREEDTDPES